MYKFKPLLKQTLWGGDKIIAFKQLDTHLDNVGESWEISGVKGCETVVASGPKAGMTLNELVAAERESLVGRDNYQRYGNEFPLLVKMLDAAKDHSVQVHPDDELAQERGMARGKTEMWYVVEAEPGSRLISGFNRDTTPEEYTAALNSGHLMELLHSEEPKPGDVYFIPAGRVHALGAGLMVAEIQQTSDCTYRIYDYDRVDSNGKKRQLHTAEAQDAIDFSAIQGHASTRYQAQPNKTTTVAACPYFITRIIPLESPIRKNLEDIDCFVIYMCVSGMAAVKAMDTIVPLHVGECVLVPASADSVELFCDNTLAGTPGSETKLLEVTIDTSDWNDEPSTENDWLAQFVGEQQ